jgi:pyruvate-formate lyase-activating enzyme
MKNPILLVADKNNKIYDMPAFSACGMEGNKLFILSAKDLIPLPSASELFVLPDRHSIGFNTDQNIFQVLPGHNAISAFIPPGYTQLFNTAYKETPKTKLLPLFSYAPVVWYKNKYHVPAIQIDKRKVHDIRFMDLKIVQQNISKIGKTKNRIIEHLKNCALTYKCPNALNFFLGKYECPIPTSPACNAKCLGCISFQSDDSCPSTQNRINFIPTPEEIAEIALLHISKVKNAIMSFGQGCEGEPLLQTEIINRGIHLIRKQTLKGTINMNTNGSLPNAVELLCKTGIDSFRISLNSVRKEFYTKYYRPSGYKFEDIIKSISIAKKHKKFVSINYLTMPGFTDQKKEFTELVKFLKKTKVNMIQWRNLNYDPLKYFEKVGMKSNDNLLGIKNIILELKKMFPKLKHGYFNLPKENWK